MDLLTLYSYPGNVRELENEIERAVLLSEPGERIGPGALSEMLTADADASTADDAGTGLRGRADSFARAEIQSALERHGGVKTRAAEELGLTYRGLLKKMQRLGMIDRADERREKPD
jgi:transcriptional regulator with PAS, ATPase and Fis domain